MGDIYVALIPILFTFGLGYLFSYLDVFKYEHGNVINNILMKLALPLTIFSSIATMSIKDLVDNAKLILMFMIFLTFGFIIIVWLLYKVFKLSLSSSTLYGLTISTPAVVFIGMKILEPFVQEHNISAALIATTIVMSFITTPITIILLTISTKPKDVKLDYKSVFISSLLEPIVTVPAVALVIALLNIKLPAVVIDSTQLLGSTTAGLAMLSAGIILQRSQFVINFKVLTVAALRNFILPVVILLIVLPFNLPSEIVNTLVISFGIPAASLAVVMSVQYKVLQKEISSIFGVSMIGTVVTLPALVGLLHVFYYL